MPGCCVPSVFRRSEVLSSTHVFRSECRDGQQVWWKNYMMIRFVRAAGIGMVLYLLMYEV